MPTYLIIGDFFEIDTRGGARDFQSRRPTPPRAYSEYKPKIIKAAPEDAAQFVGEESSD